MSSSKKTSTAAVSGDSGNAQDNLNVLYAAHQVHTLAQVVFQQISGRNWSSRAPWTSPTANAYASVYPAPLGGPGFHPTAPPALFYWYP